MKNNFSEIIINWQGVFDIMSITGAAVWIITSRMKRLEIDQRHFEITLSKLTATVEKNSERLTWIETRIISLEASVKMLDTRVSSLKKTVDSLNQRTSSIENFMRIPKKI